jgi:hypothetical protein
MAHKPVGISSALPITGGVSTSLDISAHRTDSLRVVAKGAGAHVEIGAAPTAAVTNYYVAAGEAEVLSIGKPASQRVVGLSTIGTTTIIDFPEGTGSPFAAGDAVSLTAVNQNYWNFTHKIVASVDNSAGVSGFFNTRITVNNDYGVGYAHTALIDTNFAELRGSFKVSALGDGTGTLHYQQIQSSGGAN